MCYVFQYDIGILCPRLIRPTPIERNPMVWMGVISRAESSRSTITAIKSFFSSLTPYTMNAPSPRSASHSKFFAVYLTPSADLVNGSIEAERACSLALYPADKGLAAHSRAHITFGQVLATGTGRPNWRRTRGRTAVLAVPNRCKCTRFVRGHDPT